MQRWERRKERKEQNGGSESRPRATKTRCAHQCIDRLLYRMISPNCYVNEIRNLLRLLNCCSPLSACPSHSLPIRGRQYSRSLRRDRNPPLTESGVAVVGIFAQLPA